jgi:hypothetical protein
MLEHAQHLLEFSCLILNCWIHSCWAYIIVQGCNIVIIQTHLLNIPKPLPLDRLRILPHLFLLPLFIVLWCNDYGIRDVFRGILIGIELCCRVPCHQTCFMTVGPSCYHIPIYRVICYFTHRYGGLRRNVLLKMGFTIMPIERLTHP